MDQITEATKIEKFIRLNGKIRLAVFLLALVVLSLSLYADTLRDVFFAVFNRKESSHGVFVPFISGYYVWLHRERIKQLKPEFSIHAGIVLFAAGIILFAFIQGSSSVFFPAISFFIGTLGLILLFFGPSIFKEFAFPILFLMAMIPLPSSWYLQIADWTRAITTSIAVLTLQTIQIPLFREGYSIQLPNTWLVVDYSCSGIRYLLSFFVFSLAYAFFLKNGIKSRLLVILASFPISLLGSAFRLCVIFASAYYLGTVTLEKQPHLLISWSVFFVVLVVGIGLDLILSKIGEKIQGT
jgi:exosortase